MCKAQTESQTWRSPSPTSYIVQANILHSGSQTSKEPQGNPTRMTTFIPVGNRNLHLIPATAIVITRQTVPSIESQRKLAMTKPYSAFSLPSPRRTANLDTPAGKFP